MFASFRLWLRMFLGFDRDGFADVAPAGEVPGVGKAAALEGFYGVDFAGVCFQEYATVVGAAQQCQPRSAGE